MEKIIQIHIDNDDYPMLFKIDPDELGNMCYDIFKRGYDFHFPSQQKINHETDSIKYELLQIHNSIDNMNAKDGIEKFTNIVDDLFGISNNSCKKGKISEDMIFSIIRKQYKDYTIEETRNKPYSGDAVLYIPIDNKIYSVIIEVKNYQKNVDYKEVEKLKRDMKHNNIHYAIMLSFKTGFVGKKQLSIEEFSHDNKHYYIVFVPYVMNNIDKLDASLSMITQLINFNIKNNKNIKIKWLEDNIQDHLNKLDKLCDEFAQLKSNYYKMEMSIKTNLTDFYSSMRSYEFELTNRINNVWDLINAEFNRANKSLVIWDKMDNIIASTKNKQIIAMLEIIKKNGLYVELVQNNVYNLFKNNKEVGKIYSGKEIKIIMYNPDIKITLSNDKSYNLLDTILCNDNS